MWSAKYGDKRKYSDWKCVVFLWYGRSSWVIFKMECQLYENGNNHRNPYFSSWMEYPRTRVSICIRGWGGGGGMIGAKIFSAMDQSNQGYKRVAGCTPPFQVINFFKSPSIKITFQRIWDPCGSHMGLLPGLLSFQARSQDFILGGGSEHVKREGVGACFIKLLEKEGDSLYRSRLLILAWIQFPFLRA